MDILAHIEYCKEEGMNLRAAQDRIFVHLAHTVFSLTPEWEALFMPKYKQASELITSKYNN